MAMRGGRQSDVRSFYAWQRDYLWTQHGAANQIASGFSEHSSPPLCVEYVDIGKRDVVSVAERERER
jgi:hypothetical protein